MESSDDDRATRCSTIPPFLDTLAAVLLYVLAIPLAFVHPWLSDALCVAVALTCLAPGRRIEGAMEAHETPAT